MTRLEAALSPEHAADPRRGAQSGQLPMSVFRLPDLGEGLKEAEIVTWHVGPGDHVVADQPLVSVETDKAVVEIPAPYAGRIAKLHGVKGDIIETGASLVELDEAPKADTGAIVGELEPRSAGGRWRSATASWRTGGPGRPSARGGAWRRPRRD